MAHATTETSPAAVPARPAIAPLEMGDRLTRVEFERRSQAMPELKKAELIEGVVYIPARSTAQYAGGRASVIGWLAAYRAATPGLLASANPTLRLDEDNEPQPDALLAIDSKCGGQSHVDEDSYFAGPPELIGEVASSSVSYDLHAKLHVYRRHGVREYVVWRVRDKELDWFRLDEGNYVPLTPDAQRIFKSTIYPGLWLDVAALLNGEQARVLAVLQEGIASPERVRFAAELEERRQKTERTS